MSHKLLGVALLMMASIVVISCEIDTKLTVAGGNPPQFQMTGSGLLGRLVIRGHQKQREMPGPDASAYWCIEPKDEETMRNVGKISPVTYGKVPDGYTQVYPENGHDLPPLVEGQRYYVRVDSTNANGSRLWFIIRNGKVEFSEYEHSLIEN